MYKGLIIVIALSLFFIIGIKSQPSGPRKEGKASVTQPYNHKEKKQLNIVKSFYDKIAEFPATVDSDVKDEEIVAFIHVAFLAFWMSVNFRIGCLFLSLSPNKYNVHKAKIELHFEDMMFAFIKFRSKIKDYYYKKNAVAVLYEMKSKKFDSLESSELENILEGITTMSLDFILTKDTLYEKKPDVPARGVILWPLVPDVEVNERRYKTIFSDISEARKRIFLYHFKTSEEANSVSANWPKIYMEFYSFKDDNSKWYQYMSRKYNDFNDTNIFHVLNVEVRKFINLETINKIWNFITRELTGTKNEAETALSTSWYNADLLKSVNMWKSLMGRCFVTDATSRISDTDRIRRTINTIGFIRQFDWTN